MELVHLIHSSEADSKLSDVELNTILEKSRNNNSRAK